MQQNHPEPVESPATARSSGLLAGMVGAFVWLVLFIPLTLLMAPFQSGMIQRMLSSANDMPPEFRADARGHAVGRMASGIVESSSFSSSCCSVSSVFGMIGGLFGALLFRKNTPPPPPPPMPPSSFTAPSFPPPDFPTPPIPGQERR